MNLKKHPIVEVILSVIKLIGQIIALCSDEINSSYTCISEIPTPQPFFKLSVTRLSSIP